jgi:protocatechuate 3,4-dioxygenase beta subunit
MLTTQLYFPGEAGNARDGLFRPELLMAVEGGEGGRRARFDLVLEA